MSAFTTKPEQVSQSKVNVERQDPVVEEHQDIVEWVVSNPNDPSPDAPIYAPINSDKVSGLVSVIKYRKVGDVCHMSISSISSSSPNTQALGSTAPTRGKAVPYEVEQRPEGDGYKSTSTQYQIPKRFLPYLEQGREIESTAVALKDATDIKYHAFGFGSIYGVSGGTVKKEFFNGVGHITLCGTKVLDKQQLIDLDSGSLQLTLFNEKVALQSAADEWSVNGLCATWVCESDYNNIKLNDKVGSALGDVYSQ